jgi:phosphatidylethanolamine/phosphatidyl-N-methylethanolamine N-methyltransferase
MAAQLDPERPGAVLELGGGTGAITREILAAGIHPGRVLVLERDPHFHRVLRERFPAVKVVEGDAAALGDVTRDNDVGPVNAVVSGLPMLNFPAEVQNAILNGAFEQMDDDGLFIQFTYSPAPPIPRGRLSDLGLNGERAGRVWFNVPPASVWCFRRIRGESTEQR